jgi:hypothetical protein
LDVNYDISNEKEEDVVINNNNISIKHSSNKNNSQSGIKIIWTVDIEKRNEFLSHFTFTCDLIIVYVRFDKTLKNGYIEIIYICRDELINQQLLSNTQQTPIFKCLEGNSRGIEFDKAFFEKIVQKSLFHIKINFSNINCDMYNPIAKRLKLLYLLYTDEHLNPDAHQRWAPDTIDLPVTLPLNTEPNAHCEARASGL